MQKAIDNVYQKYRQFSGQLGQQAPVGGDGDVYARLKGMAGGIGKDR